MKARPAPRLAPYVDHYWVTRWDRRGVSPRNATMLTDPCVHLHVRDGQADVMGVVRGTFRMRLGDVGCVIGVRFRPGGFYPFVRQSIAQWTDRTVPADDVFGSNAGEMAWANALSADVESCRGDREAHATIAASHLDAFLAPRLTARDDVAEEMARLVELLGSRPDVRRVSDLARLSRRSERTLHRLFLRYVGVSPAWVVRRYRLHEAARRLTTCPDTDVRALACDLGYADQAHFIREFRETIGVTPGAYVRAAER